MIITRHRLDPETGEYQNRLAVDALQYSDISPWLFHGGDTETAAGEMLKVGGQRWDQSTISPIGITEYNGILTGCDVIYGGSTQSIADAETDLLSFDPSSSNVISFNKIIVIVQIITINAHTITVSYQEVDLDGVSWHTFAGDATAGLVAVGHTKLVISNPGSTARLSVTCAGGVGSATYRCVVIGKG